MNRLRSMGVWLAMLAGIVGVTLLLMVFAGYFHTKVDAKPSTRLRPAPAGAKYVVVAEITQPRYESAIVRDSYYARSNFLWPRLVADFRADRVDAVHAVRNPCDLLATLCNA